MRSAWFLQSQSTAFGNVRRSLLAPAEHQPWQPLEFVPFESPAEADTVSIPPGTALSAHNWRCVFLGGEDLIENVCSVSDTAEGAVHSHLKTALKERYKSILFQAE